MNNVLYTLTKHYFSNLYFKIYCTTIFYNVYVYIGKFHSLKIKGWTYKNKIINKNYVYSLRDKFPTNNKILKLYCSADINVVYRLEN